MSVSKETILTQLRYTAWASERLVHAAAQLSPDELQRDFGTSEKSVLGTLVHVFAADRIWMGRVNGNLPAVFVDPEKDMHLETLRNEWPPIHQSWQKWADGMTDFSATMKYKDLKGNPQESLYWQVVFHVINHGTHHRGQASGMLRALGIVPPPIDMSYYYRELK
ncbi:MAG: DinB family protein [Candidatus Solibacter usitatus]|nr:DinB family protein [Candidatus Solibacter usitatus]